MRGLAVMQANKDSAGLVFTNKVSIENKEFRDPLLVLGQGNVIAATLSTTKPKNLPFTPKKTRFEEEELSLANCSAYRNPNKEKFDGKRSLGTNIHLSHFLLFTWRRLIVALLWQRLPCWFSNVDCNLHEFSVTLGHLDCKLLLSITFTSSVSFYIAQSHFSRSD